MIDVETGAKCKDCGRPIARVPGRRPREFCNDACRQRYHRKQKAGHPRDLAESIDAKDQQIATLKAENRTLRAQLEAIQLANERFRNDTQVRAFPAWLEKHARYYAKSPFGRRFIADRHAMMEGRKAPLLPPQASRSEYERIIRYTLKYAEEDIETFREAWREMLKTQF